MLHPEILRELLDGEVGVAAERHANRCALSRHGACVHADLPTGTVIAFDGSRYDAEPFGVAVIDDGHEVLPHDRWPPGLSLGKHPILGRAFICIRGTAEYHLHPSHLLDRWDLHRGKVQLVDLLGHVLNKAGG